MDTSKVIAAINAAHQELNGLIDGEFKARRVNGLRRLQNAASALELAAKHVTAAAEQVKPKAPKAPAA